MYHQNSQNYDPFSVHYCIFYMQKTHTKSITLATCFDTVG